MKSTIHQSFLIFLLLLQLFFIEVGYAQKFIPEQGSNKLYGFVDPKSKGWKIEPRYESADSFRSNYAIVSIDGKYGLINSHGHLVVPAKYQLLEGERLYSFKLDDSTGIIDIKGRILLKGDFTYVYVDPNTFSAILFKNDKYGYWDTSSVLIPPFSIYELMFENNVAYFNTGQTTGFINKKGDKLIEISEGKLWELGGRGFIVSEKDGEKFYNGTGKYLGKFERVVQVADHFILYMQHSKFGLMSQEGDSLSFGAYEIISPFNSFGYSVVKKNNLYGIIDTMLREVLPIQYEYIQNLGENFNRLSGEYETKRLYSLIQQNHSYGVVTDSAKIILDPQFSNAYAEQEFLIYEKDKKIGIRNLLEKEELPISDVFVFNQDKAIFFFYDKETPKYGLINKDGYVVVPSSYRSIQSLWNGYFIAENQNGVGILDTTGIELVPCIYKNIYILNDLMSHKKDGNILFDNYLYAVTKSGKCGVYNRNGDLAVDTVYYNLTVYDDDGENFWGEDKNGRYKIISKYGKPIKIALDKPVNFSEKIAIASRKGKKGIINSNGKIITKFKYEEIIPQANKSYLIRKDSLWGLLSNDGKVLVKPRFKVLTDYNEGFAFAKDKVWGTLSEQGIFTPGFVGIKTNFINEKVNGFHKASFSFSYLNNIDELSCDLLVDDSLHKIIPAEVNNYILNTISQSLKGKRKEFNPLLVINKDSTKRTEKENYTGEGIEILNSTNTTATLNYFYEVNGKGFNKVEEKRKVVYSDNGKIKEVQLKDLFIETDYTSFLNEHIASKLREADYRFFTSSKSNTQFFDSDQFQIDKKGLVLKVNEKILDLTFDIVGPEVIIGYEELESIAKKDGALKEFYK
jgi:hypothetical protein